MIHINYHKEKVFTDCKKKSLCCPRFLTGAIPTPSLFHAALYKEGVDATLDLHLASPYQDCLPDLPFL